MLGIDRRRQERALDRYWDSLVSDERSAPDSLAPELKATLARTYALATEPSPAPSFVAALEERLLPQPVTVRSPAMSAMATAMAPNPPAVAHDWPPSRPSVWLRTRRNAWPMMELAAVILVLLLAGSFFAAGEVRRPTGSGPTAPPGSLYVSDDFQSTDPLQQYLTAIDPLTLRDLAGRSVVTLNDPKASTIWAMWGTSDPSVAFAASADGSTVAQIEPVWANAAPIDPNTQQIRDPSLADGATIVIRDATTGRIRRRINMPEVVDYPLLNRDGRRIVVRMAGKPGWLAFDTVSGRQSASIINGVTNTEVGAISPNGTRLYVLRGLPSNTIPLPAELVVYDLTVSGELEEGPVLENVPAGIVTYGKTNDGQPIQREFAPGLAISPDGKTLAIAHAENDEITLLDASAIPIKVARTFTPTTQTSFLGRVLAWLPLAPRDAAAKEEVSTLSRFVSFSRDGTRLYVIANWTGESPCVVALACSGTPFGTGLQAVDLATGQQLANLPNMTVSALLSAPDGKTLYVFGARSANEPETDGEFMLRRLDGTTLQTLAQRGFSGYRWVVLTR